MMKKGINRIASLFVAFWILLSTLCNGVVFADGNIFVDDYDTANSSKIPNAFYSENMQTLTLSTSIHGDNKVAIRIDRDKPGVAVYKATNVGAIRLRGSNDNGDNEDYSFFWSTDNVEYTQISPVKVDLGKGGSFYACDYYFAGLPGGEIYFKIYIPYVAGRERYNRCLMKLEIESETTTIIENYDASMLDQFDLFFAENSYMRATEGIDGEAALRFAYMKNTMSKLILSEKRFDTEMTRGEFADSLLRMMFVGNVPMDRVYHNKMPDVLSSTDYAAAIEFAVELGYMSRTRDSRFHPEDPITVQDAKYALMCMLGYQSLLTSQNIDSLARKTKFDAPVKNGKLTVREAAKLIFNAMDAYIAGDDYVGTMWVSDEKFIDKYLKVRMIEGQMTYSRHGDLSDYDSDDKNMAVIDGVEVYMSNSSFHENIGRYVYAYIEDDNGKNKVLSYGIENSSVKQPRIIKRDFDASASSLTQIRYSDNEKDRTLKVDIKKAMLNGERVTGNPTSLYGICDVLTFLDSDSDGICDTVLGEKYDNYYVGSLFTANNGFADFYYTDKKVYVDSDIYDHVNYFRSGVPASFKDIKIGSLVSVAKSDNDRFIKIIICEDFDEGRIDPISNSDGSLKVGENKYYISDSFENMVTDGKVTMPKAGESGKLLLDPAGEVAVFIKTHSSEEYGFLIGCGTEGRALAETTFVKIFGGDGIVSDYECASKVSIVQDGTTSRVNSKDVHTTLKANPVLTSSGTCEGLIKYGLNTKNEITRIVIPEEKIDVLNHAEFSLNYKATNAISGKSGLIDNSYSVDSNTKIFCIPYDRDRTDLYKNSFTLATDGYIAAGKKHGVSQSVCLYNINSCRNAEIMVVFDKSADAKSTAGNRFSSVKEILMEYDAVSETVKDKIKLINKDKEMEFFVEDGIMLRKGKIGTSAAELVPGSSVKDLHVGDVIYYTLNGAGEIGKITVLYDSANKVCYKENGDTLTATGFVRDQEYGVAYADVKGVFGKYVYFGIGSTEHLLVNASGVVVFNEARKNVSLESADELDVGDRVIIRYYRSEVSDIYKVR